MDVILQLDVSVKFRVPELSPADDMLNVNDSNAQVICSERGVSRNGAVGPFGLLVLASDDLTEQTAVFFYIVSVGGRWNALVCSDQSRFSFFSL